MAGELRKGERIHEDHFQNSQKQEVWEMVSEEMVLKTALEDTNEYGPHSMIVLLMIVATITGAILLAFRYI